MLNIVIPMAGAGSRFANAGYKNPKPLIDICGQPMIEVVVNNLRPSCPHRFIFICQKAHIEAYRLTDKLNVIAPGSMIVAIDGLTEGAACTVLAASTHINNSDPLMIANSDQYIDVDINNYLQDMESRGLSGLIMTMTADNPKWSFVSLTDQCMVTHVVEKEVISNEATVGIYNFSSGADFVAAAEKMIDEKRMANGEYYVAPVYNELIALDAKIGIFNIGSEGQGMYGLGIPSDLDKFLLNPLVESWLS